MIFFSFGLQQGFVLYLGLLGTLLMDHCPRDGLFPWFSFQLMLHLAYKTLPMGFLVFSSQGKERKEKVHSSKVAHSCTIRNKVAFKKKNTQIIQHECEMDHHFGLLQKIFHFMHIWGMSWVQKNERERTHWEKEKH